MNARPHRRPKPKGPPMSCAEVGEAIEAYFARGGEVHVIPPEATGEPARVTAREQAREYKPMAERVSNLPERHCLWCCVAFQPASHNSYYHSDECRAAGRANDRAIAKATLPEILARVRALTPEERAAVPPTPTRRSHQKRRRYD
jgi:hypothetical protein